MDTSQKERKKERKQLLAFDVASLADIFAYRALYFGIFLSVAICTHRAIGNIAINFFSGVHFL